METIGVLLILAAIVLFIVIAIRGVKLVIKKKKRTDKSTLKLGVAAVALVVIGGILIPSDDSIADEDENKTEAITEDVEEETEGAAGEVELTFEEKLTNVVIDTVGETSNTKQDRIVEITYFNDGEKDIVSLTLNANENLSNKLTRKGILQDSAKLIEAFDENKYSGDINFKWELPLTDSHGNVENGKVMSFLVEQESIEKINFDNFDYNKLPDISESYDEHPALRE